MIRSTLRMAGLACLALGAIVTTSALTTTAALSQGGYMGQRATQDRDYSRLHAATQRAYGKTEKVTLAGKKKKRHKHRHKRHKHKH